MNYIHASIGALAIAVSASLTLSAHAVVINDFNNVDTGSGPVDLADVPDWSTNNSSETDVWEVTSGVGVDGSNGVTTGVRGANYIRNLNASEALTPADGVKTLTMDLKLGATGVDGYQIFEILAGQNGGVNAFLIQFNGGSSNGKDDNYLRVTDGGMSWGNVETRTIDARWESETWYTLQLTFATQNTGKGNDVTGVLDVFETDTPTNVLLDGEVIRAAGENGGPFNTFDYLRLKEPGANNRYTHIDNIAIIPEPGSLALLFVGLVSMCRLRRA